MTSSNVLYPTFNQTTINEEKNDSTSIDYDQIKNNNIIEPSNDKLYNKTKEGDIMSEASDKRVVDMLIKMQTDNKQDIKDVEKRIQESSDKFMSQLMKENREFKESVDGKLSDIKNADKSLRNWSIANLVALAAIVFSFIYFGIQLLNSFPK